MTCTPYRGARCFVIAALAVVTATSSRAQAPPQTSQPAPAGPAAAKTVRSTDDGYRYNPQGRRDPFVSLVNRASDPGSAGSRPEGLAGVLVNEVVVKGILRTPRGFEALIQAADTKTYTLRPGDRLMDGTVKAVESAAVVLLKEVNDPLSLVKQQEVRKMLRPLEPPK